MKAENEGRGENLSLLFSGLTCTHMHVFQIEAKLIFTTKVCCDMKVLKTFSATELLHV
jgi:hypothetical protein